VVVGRAPLAGRVVEVADGTVVEVLFPIVLVVVAAGDVVLVEPVVVVVVPANVLVVALLVGGAAVVVVGDVLVARSALGGTGGLVLVEPKIQAVTLPGCGSKSIAPCSL
jgi:hypothetical protein